MTTELRRICAFYSKGRNYVDVLRRVRQDNPAAQIYAMVPARYPLSDAEGALADEVLRIDRERYGWRDLLAFLHLLGRIRKARYDVFIIAFDSPRLRILAALSGASRCAYCTLEGRLVDIQPSVSGTLANVTFRNVWGRLVYAGVWCAVHFLRVGR